MSTPADIGDQLQAAGFLVLQSGEVEAAGAAFLLQISPKTLRNMRAECDGPPFRVARRLVWYSIDAVLAWRGTLASLQSSATRAKFAPRSTAVRAR